MKKKIKNIDNFLRKFDLQRDVIKDSNITIETNENTYLPKGEMENGWLYNLYSKFTQELGLIPESNSMAIVGIGAGVESLLFLELLKIKKLYCFDVNRGVLPAAKNNVVKNLKKPERLSLTVEYSDLLDYLMINKIKVDLIYENLPNLRISSSILIDKGLTTASFYSETGINKNDNIPNLFDKNMLRLHYRFLLQAKECLLPNGKVICCIGARVPIEIIESMFICLGFSFKLINIALIQQFAALEVVDTYREIEENGGAKFLFLPHNNKKIKQLIADYKKMDDLSVLYDSIKKYGFSATEAYAKLAVRKGIDHLGLVIEGSLIS